MSRTVTCDSTVDLQINNLEALALAAKRCGCNLEQSIANSYSRATIKVPGKYHSIYVNPSRTRPDCFALQFDEDMGYVPQLATPGGKPLNKLINFYQLEANKAQAQAMGYVATEVQLEGEEIELQLRPAAALGAVAV